MSELGEVVGVGEKCEVSEWGLGGEDERSGCGQGRAKGKGRAE